MKMMPVGGEQRAPNLRRSVFGVEVDVVSQEEAVRRVVTWCRNGETGGIVVTPNLDHVVKLRSDEALRRAYTKARLVLADGKPLVWLSRLDRGLPLELVTGSDLIEPVCVAAAREGSTVFLLGSRLEVLQKAATILTVRCPGLQIAGFYSPPMGFDRSQEEVRKALEAVQTAAPDILFVALGSPKQEVWAAEYAGATGAKAILCIGAGLDFIAGISVRAPAIFRRIGAEWLWRVLSEPRRLGGRYLRIFINLPLLAMRHVSDLRSAGRGRS